MKRLLPRNQQGQGTLEMALVIAVVCAALIAMAPYLGRRVKGYVQSHSGSIAQQSWGNSAEMVMTSNSNSDSYSDALGSRSVSDSLSNQTFNVGAFVGGGGGDPTLPRTP